MSRGRETSSLRRRALAVLGFVAAVAVLLEIGAWALVETGRIEAPPPHRGRTGFWWHQHPEFGAWHHPDMEGDHHGACYTVRYRTNSVGARDAERPRAASEPRVVVLGDSFLEGYGVRESSRLSNQLEEATGIPHLNFAMASFGPYQQYLVYRDLAKQFDHTAVMVSLLPANDFADSDLALATTLPDREAAYRPYLVGEPPQLSRLDHREPGLRRLLRLHSYAFNAVQAAVRARRAREFLGHESFFYEFSDHHFRLLEAILGRLAEEAGGRRVVVLLIPTLPDLERFAEEGPDPLSARLRGVAMRHGIRFVNLLPRMAGHVRSWDAYFHACDFHWSHYGNRVARDYVLRELRGDIYPALAQR